MLNEAITGVRWMPWHLQAMKDVEGCEKPRGAATQAWIRGYLNGATPPALRSATGRRIHSRAKRTGRTETSQYPQEQKSYEIPSVAASERGPAQTGRVSRLGSLLGPGCGRRDVSLRGDTGSDQDTR